MLIGTSKLIIKEKKQTMKKQSGTSKKCEASSKDVTYIIGIPEGYKRENRAEMFRVTLTKNFHTLLQN